MFSKKSLSVFVYLMLTVALMALVSCSGSQSTETVEEETPCDNHEGSCLAVSFDGTNCTVAGPTDNHTGELAVIFSNQSEGQARVEVARIKSYKTIQDLEEDTRDRPTGGAPSWIVRMRFWEQPVDPGETVTFQANTRRGDYGVLCFKIPQYVVFGDGFSIVE